MSRILEFVELEAHQWPVARRLIAGAFLDEPFVVGMFGPSPVDRFLGMLRLHHHYPSAPGELVLGACGDGVLLAVATSPSTRRGMHTSQPWPPTRRCVVRASVGR